MLVLEIAAGILLALVVIEMADELVSLAWKLTVLLVLCSPPVILFSKDYVVAGFVYLCVLGIGLAVYAYIRTLNASSRVSNP